MWYYWLHIDSCGAQKMGRGEYPDKLGHRHCHPHQSQFSRTEPITCTHRWKKLLRIVSWDNRGWKGLVFIVSNQIPRKANYKALDQGRTREVLLQTQQAQDSKKLVFSFLCEDRKRQIFKLKKLGSGDLLLALWPTGIGRGNLLCLLL